MPREKIEPHTDDKRYVRRGKKSKFTSRQVEVGRSLSADRRSKAGRSPMPIQCRTYLLISHIALLRHQCTIIPLPT
jgi:hypothetical protein